MKIIFDKHDYEEKTFHYTPCFSLYKHCHGEDSPMHLHFCIEFRYWCYEIEIGKSY